MAMNYTRHWLQSSPEHFFESCRSLAALIGTAADGMLVLDEAGMVLAYNQACARIFQYGEEDVLGRSVEMLIPAPFATDPAGEASILGTGREVQGWRKDGSSFALYLSLGEGQLDGRHVFTAIVHDLSALRRERESYEARLFNLHQELAHLARVSELGQVTAGIAHELNQPLAAILNYANAAKRLAASGTPGTMDKVQAVLSTVAEQAERAGQIVRRMRGFLEKQTGRFGAEDLTAIAEDALALGLIGSAPEKMTIRFQPEAGLPLVVADRVQIQQVLVNLVRNAADAMADAPRRELMVSLRRKGTMVEVAVADSGPGIAPDIAAKLFKPFVTNKPHGMGIGLAISKSIIEAHGGTLSVEENPGGGGALFRFTLPVSPGQSADASATV